MDGHLKKSPELGHLTDNSDAKYVSGLSTILVATIQETKDRISQIEYIFCSQLFPKFQQNTQSLQKIYSEARKAADKEKEKDLLLQIKKLQHQNQHILDDNQLLKSENEKLITLKKEAHNRVNELQEELNQKIVEENERREAQQNLQNLLESKLSLLHSYKKTTEQLEEKNTMLLKMQKKLEVDNEGLQQELMMKAKEVDDTMELHNKLLQANQSKSSLILQKDIKLKEIEEKTNGLIPELANMDSKVNELLSELREKTEEVEKGKELQANLLKKIEFQASEIMNNEQLLNKYEKENRLLASKVGCLTTRVDELQNELNLKTSELGQLLRQSDSFKFEIVNRGQASDGFELEKKRLLDKQKGLGEQVDKLQRSLSERTKESAEEMELHRMLLKQIEAKDSELLSERRKMSDLIASHKNLLSQHNYLHKKYNLTPETMTSHDKGKVKNEVTRQNQTPAQPHDIEKNTSEASDLNCDIMKPMDEQKALLVKRISPASRILISPNCPSSSKPGLPAGTKRSSSYWRDTRSHQSRVGPDPHDDFLDTPLENVRENLGNAVKRPPDFPKSGSINMSLDDSDDQTQDINPDYAKPNKLQKSPPKAGTSGYKYVEPVRKKSERENLKGVECKQCKKFYDAVLPDGGKNSDANKQSMRCEHQDGVSRHRYRYAPPSTPEGFWNIGFESEM